MADAFLRLVNGGAKFNLPGNNANNNASSRVKQHSAQNAAPVSATASASLRNKFNFFGSKSSSAVVAESSSEEEESEEGDEYMDDEDEEYETDALVQGESLSLKDLQRKYEISVKGFQTPRLQDSFTAMQASSGVPSHFVKTLYGREDRGGFQYKSPTPAQMQAVPVLMNKRELQLYAPTGSGKTMAFVLPMLSLLSQPPKEGEYSEFTELYKEQKKVKPIGKFEVKLNKVVKVLPYRGLILAPTKELAFQTYKVMKKLASSEKGEGSWKINMLTKGAMRGIKKSMNIVSDVHVVKKGSSATNDDDDDNDDDEEEDKEEEDEIVENENTMKEIVSLSKHSIGIHNGNMEDDNNNSVDFKRILVTTPMSLALMLVKDNLIMPLVRMLVIDEADKLFDFGFLEQIDCILGRCNNPQIQRVLCSATISSYVEELASRILRDPIRIVVGGRNVAQSMVTQKLIYVGNEDGKSLAIRQQLQHGLNVPMLIFTQSKERAMQVYDEFKLEPIHMGVIHSDMTSDERLDVMNDFRIGKVWVLVCTDVMARGIDFRHVNSVINFDFPQSVPSYIHRIGRTGRAGRQGEAWTFVTDQDKVLLPEIAQIVRDSAIAQKYGYAAVNNISNIDLSNLDVHCPQWMQELPKSSKKSIQLLAEHAPKRESVNITNKQSRREETSRKRKRMLKVQQQSVFTSRGEQGGAKTMKNQLTKEQRDEKRVVLKKRKEKKKTAEKFKKMKKNKQD